MYTGIYVPLAAGCAGAQGLAVSTVEDVLETAATPLERCPTQARIHRQIGPSPESGSPLQMPLVGMAARHRGGNCAVRCVRRWRPNVGPSDSLDECLIPPLLSAGDGCGHG